MRLITYKNPFEFQSMSFWDDLHKYPHLCVSQTLVEGLKRYYHRESFSLICTIDNFLKHFYSEWHGNNELKLIQAVLLSKAIKKIKDPKLQSTFKHNRDDILQSIRFIIECGLRPNDIGDRTSLSEEQKCLVDLYEELFVDPIFQTLFNQEERGVEGLQTCAKEILIKELERELDLNLSANMKAAERLKVMKESISARKTSNKQKEVRKLDYIYQFLEKMDAEGEGISFQKVFIHGVHQFTPMIHKFVNRLKELGTEVIFLFNYCSEFKMIYSTWDQVYKWTREDIEENGLLFRILPRPLGENIANVFEGKIKDLQETSEVLYKFDNLTSFTDYVSPIYESAKKTVQENRENSSHRNMDIIKNMKEQFYAVDGSEMNSLLKVYFPEHFGARHFLSYPIGQFILGLYNMWDNDKKKIKIEDRYLKECLSLNIWKFREGLTPLQMYYDLSLYFKGATTFDEYKRRLDKIKRTVNAEASNREQTRKLSFFSYSETDVDNFIKVIEYINNFASQFFKNGTVNLKGHFTEVIEYISLNMSSLDISNKERNFIDEIKIRLNEMEIENVVADIEDIKGTLHFYLAANEDKDQEAEWIVRDFEQIDGGILMAKAREEDGSGKMNPIYHFAGLSDENLLGKSKKSLPFPITVEMIDGINEVATLVATCKKEYVHFLRYSLFYGTYFLTPINSIYLSYIEDLGKESSNPYSIFEIINLPIKNQDKADNFENTEPLLPFNDSSAVMIDADLDDSMKRSAVACYLRFLYNHCLDEFTYYNDEFNLFYVSQLLATYTIIKNMNQVSAGVTLSKFKNLYPFMDTIDFKQVEKMVRTIINNNIRTDNIDFNYINTKLEFKYAKWQDENKNNLFKHIINADKTDQDQLIKNLDRFINNDQFSFLPENHNWKICDVCNQKYVCSHGLKEKH